MVNGIRTSYSQGFNKGFSLKAQHETPEEDQREPCPVGWGCSNNLQRSLLQFSTRPNEWGTQ